MPDRHHEPPHAGTSPSRKARRDGVTRVLTYASLLVAIGVLALLAYIAYALLAAPKVPRTALERDVLRLEVIVEENPRSPRAWSDYIQSLTKAGLHARAARTIGEARSAVGTATAVTIEEARSRHARGRSEEALELLDGAVEQARGEYDAAVAALAAKGVVSAPKPVDLIAALLLRGEVMRGLGDWRGVVDAYTEALELDRTMADIQVARGTAYLELGDATAARRDFEGALRFIPDYEPALEGLERAKAVQGQ